MKKTALSTCVFVLAFFSLPPQNCCGQETENRSGESDVVYLSQNSRFFDKLETQFLNLMNLARQDPARFAETYLAEHARKDGKIAEFYRRMKTVQPMAPLRPSKALSLAARDHVREMYTTRIGKTGKKRKASRWARIEKYGKWQGHVALSMSYGYSEPDSISFRSFSVPAHRTRATCLIRKTGWRGHASAKIKYIAICVLSISPRTLKNDGVLYGLGHGRSSFSASNADNKNMIHSVSGNIQALGRYTQEMAGIADRVSTAFAPDSDTDIAKEFVDMMIVKHAFSANIAAIRSEDEMIGTVLNVFA